MVKEKEYDVVIIGSGPAGLCAAHELAEQGLKVCVLEANDYLGGKPISWQTHPYWVPAGGDNWTTFCQMPLKKLEVTLPGEHAFRVYPDNYQNLMSIMKRIPRRREEGKGDVTQNLVNTLRIAAISKKKKVAVNKTFFSTLLSKLEALLFGLALYVPYLVCEERAIALYDKISFGENINYFERSKEMRQYLDRISGTSASGNPRLMSAVAVSNLLLNYYYAPNQTGMQTFGLPTEEAWLKPWQDYLRKLGVDFYTNNRLCNFEYKRDLTATTISERDFSTSIAAAIAETTTGQEVRYRASYYISAIPANDLANIINSHLEILRYEPRLARLFQITTLPATGVQLFYEETIQEIAQEGYGFYLCDHPWEISFIQQTSLWTNPERYAHGRMVVTIYVAILNAPGPLFGKTMLQCTPQEIAAEMFTAFEQTILTHRPTAHIPKRIGFFAHHFMPSPETSQSSDSPQGQGAQQHLSCRECIDQERLHLCIPGLYPLRPRSNEFYLNNLLLAGAYAQNKTYYVSTMESAAESGREAANKLLGFFNKKKITVYTEVQLPRWIRWLRRLDYWLYYLYCPNPLSLLLSCLRRYLHTKSINIHPSVYDRVNFHNLTAHKIEK